jgi:hypothetical protein
MKISQIAVLPILACLSIAFILGVTPARAQFSKPVVVLKGCVFTQDAKPATVRLSIHETGETVAEDDTSNEITTCGIQEITAGRANSESGRYLLILKPGRKYWIHIEGTFVQSIDSLLQMPKTDKPLTIEENFVVNWRQNPDGSTPASSPDPAARKD